MATKEHRKRAPEPARRKRRQDERGKPVAPDVAAPPESKEEAGFLFDPYWDDVFAAYFDPTLRVCCLLRY